MFKIKEIFPTIQGEGSRAGAPAIFVRFSGCNLWSGREADRANGTGMCAGYCDTKFVDGENWDISLLIEHIMSLASGWEKPLLVLTGGEPLLQLCHSEKLEDARSLLTTLLRAGWDTALETNGTRPLSNVLAPHFSHVTVSPKPMRSAPASTQWLFPMRADDLKIVVPTPLPVKALIDIYRRANLYFQPVDLEDKGAAALDEAVRLARLYGGKVSCQTHKFLGMP